MVTIGLPTYPRRSTGCGEGPVTLLDDVLSELHAQRRHRVLEKQPNISTSLWTPLLQRLFSNPRTASAGPGATWSLPGPLGASLDR